MFLLGENTLEFCITFILFVYDYSAIYVSFRDGGDRKIILTLLYFLGID
jgi:hypothetical protein